MKRTTRNNILRYAISAMFVSAYLLVMSLICIGLDWITDKTGWPVYTVVLVACFIYVVYIVGKGITTKDEKEE